ncbi:hypothetical protein ACFL1I_03620 [Candidatus Omnitrophota bacterium]
MLKKNRGVALLIALTFIFLVVVLGAAAVILATGHFGTSYRQIQRARALYAAEAGMQHALYMCRTGAYNLNAAPFTDSGAIAINYPRPGALPDEVYTVDIDVYAAGSDPLGDGHSAAPNTYPIIVQVNF